MRLLKNRRFKGFYLCFVLLLILIICGSAIAYADSGTAKTTVKAGSLTESSATNQENLQVSKKLRMASYALPITVIDARGSGKGWKLTITSTRFKMTSSKGELPTNASSITGVSLSCNAHSTCTNPTNSISYPLIVPAGNPLPRPVKFFNASVKSGLGKFLLSMMVNVTIPHGTNPGTYSSTVILAIANGP